MALMAAPDIDAIATAARAVLDDAGIVLDGNTLKVYEREPKDFDSLPGAVIRWDSFQRVGPDEPESQLGANDWRLTFEVVVAVPLDEPGKAQEDLRDVMVSVIDAFDDNETLNRNDVLSARLADGEMAYTDDPERRPLHICTARLEVWALSHY